MLHAGSPTRQGPRDPQDPQEIRDPHNPQRPQQSTSRRRRAVGIGALLGAALGLGGLLVVQGAIPRQPGRLPDRAGVLWLTLAWWTIGVATAALLLRAVPRRAALGLLLAGMVALHAVGIAHGPQLSDDFYRYAWDGRVQAAGIDPYRYGPLDPELAHLRDEWLFPDPAGCAARGHDVGCTRLNYPWAHTIYPPLAQAYFTAVHLLPGPPRENKIQLYASVLSVALVVALMVLLARRGRDPRYAGFLALSPLAGLEVGSDAHVDVLAALFAVGCVALLRGPARAGPGRRRAALGGVLLGLAVAVKLYPVLLLPAAARRRPLVVTGAAAGVVGLSYLPHLLVVGPDVLGFLPTYLDVEGYDRGSRFLLLAWLGLHGTLAKAVAVSLLAAVAVAVLRSDPERVPIERAALYLVGAALLVATPVQPWYGILLGALAVLAGRPEWLAVAAAAHPVYISLFADLPGDAGTLRVFSYAAGGLIVLAATMVRRLMARGSGASRLGAGRLGTGAT